MNGTKKSKRKKSFAGIVLAIVLVCSVYIPVAAADNTPKLFFSGVTMHTADDGSVQAFIDFGLKNVESNGVSFTLEYNTNYVTLSDITSNAALAVNNPSDTSYLQLNETAGGSDTSFKTGTFLPPVSQMYASTDNYGRFRLEIAVWKEAENSNLIGEKKYPPEDEAVQDTKVIKATGKEVKLGRISFRVNDPAEFARLSDVDLERVFRIASADGDFGEGEQGGFLIKYIDTSSYPPTIYYEKNTHLDYEFHIENTIDRVIVDDTYSTVTAAEVYRTGTGGDLLSYLNQRMQNVTVCYTDGTRIADTVTWGDITKGYTYDKAWNPKGDTYTVTQKYNDDIKMTAKLTVKPVKVIDYTSENDFIGYESTAAAPVAYEDLDFPEKASPVFDRTVPDHTHYSVSVSETGWSQISGPAADGGGMLEFLDQANRTEGTYVFSAAVVQDELPAWATAAADGTVSVTRAIGNLSQTPTETEISAVVQDDGTMVITVGAIGTLTELADGTGFLVKMPNGEVIDPDGCAPFAISLNTPTSGSAVITVKAGNTTTNAQQARLEQYINLGNRLGSFAIAAVEPGKVQSGWTPFRTAPRRNIYVPGEYAFDFSRGGSDLFPFKKNMTAPPLSITLPTNSGANNSVKTTYSGYDGTEPGALRTVTVDSWTMTSGAAASLQAGDVVEFTGVLADTSYAGYGNVENPDNGATIKLMLRVSEQTDEEKITPIDDFIFDKKQIGYTSNDIQTKEFTITNTGNVDIIGSTVTIIPDDTTAGSPFLLRVTPAYALQTGGSTGFEISTAEDLPVGTYMATVRIGSAMTAELDSFRITFEVTQNPVHRVKLTVNGSTESNLGEAIAPGGYTYEEGETVTIQAIAAEDCNFVKWTALQGGVIGFTPNSTTTEVSFRMPGSNMGYVYDDPATPEGYVRIDAEFRETPAAKLKLQSLALYNPDDSENKLRDASLAEKAFEVKTRTYYAVAPSGVTQNRATLKLIDPAQTNITVTAEVLTSPGGTTVTPTVTEGTERGSYNIDLFAIEEMPKENVLTITLANPGGEQRKYTVHIYRRKAASELLQFGYGNSPYGLIMQDANVAADQKDAWKEKFKENNRFITDYTPTGGKTDLVYWPDTWSGTNYDQDDSALFVYNGESFTDPGIRSLVDSLGKAVNPATVKRQLTVTVIEDADSGKSLMEDFRAVSAKTFSLPNVAAADEEAPINVLSALRVRPDVYYISYTFKDFDGASITVKRPLIILYGRGDVNLSGTADATDGELIANRAHAGLPYDNLPGYTGGGKLYRARICDANLDRNINIADRNMIEKSGGTMTEFYKNN